MYVSEQMIGRRLCCATIAIHLTLLGPLAVTGADGLAEELVLPLARGRVPYRAITYYHAAPLLINSRSRTRCACSINDRATDDVFSDAILVSLSVDDDAGKSSLYV